VGSVRTWTVYTQWLKEQPGYVLTVSAVKPGPVCTVDTVNALYTIKHYSVCTVDTVRVLLCMCRVYSKNIILYVQWIQKENLCLCVVDKVTIFLCNCSLYSENMAPFLQ
jgi:hypothetical protein